MHSVCVSFFYMANQDIDRIWILATRKLAGEATNSELAELAALLQQYPEQEALLQMVAAQWETAPQSDTEFLEATYLVHLNRMNDKGYQLHNPDLTEAEPEPRRRRKSVYLVLSGVMMLVAVSLVMLLLQNNKVQPSQGVLTENQSAISTRNGSRTKIQLPDGSTVWLNADSKLEYDKTFGNTLREVRLTGEAFFDVVRNPEKPFIIHTTATDVKVLGTQFNVKSYPGDKTNETSLIHGSVEVLVKKRGEKWVLRPNEKLVVDNQPSQPDAAPEPRPASRKEPMPLVAISKLTYQANDTIAVEASWTRNRLSFKNESFAEVARKMERWYDVSFEFRDKSLEDLSVYGTFTNESLVQALEALQFSFGFRYSVQNKKVVIY
jgi:transmembrane sensor